jgi:hypothetical protein
MAFYEKGHVRIHYQEAGSGFPLFVIPGGGQNSTIDFMSDRAPFNATAEFKRVPLHHRRPAQRAERPVLRAARDRSALGLLCR